MAKKRRKASKGKGREDSQQPKPSSAAKKADPPPKLPAENLDKEFPLAAYLPFLLIGAIVVLWFWPIAIQGQRPIGDEITSVYIPKMSYYDEALGQGRIGLWNERSDFGAPMLAQGEVGSLYPPHLALHFLFDTWTAIAASMMLHFMLAGFFAYMCARGFGISRAGSLLAGLVFIGQGFFISHAAQPWSYTTGCWLPLAVLTTWRWTRTRNWNWLLGLILTLAMQLLAGHFQIAFYTIVVVVMLGLATIVAAEDRKQAALRSLFLPVAIFVSLCVAAAQLVPTLELLAQADSRGRGYWFLASYSTPPLHLVRLFAPTLLRDPMWDAVAWVPWKSSADECLHYVGLLPLGLAVWTITRFARTDPAVGICGSLLGICLIFSLGSYIPGFQFLIQLPVLGWFSAACRWGVASGLFIALLAAWGLERIDVEVFRRWFPKFVLVSAVLLGMGTLFIVQVARTSERFEQTPNDYRGLDRSLAFYNAGYSQHEVQTMTPAKRLWPMLIDELTLPAIHLLSLAGIAFFATSAIGDRRRFVVVVLVWSAADLTASTFLLRPMRFVDAQLWTQASPVLSAISEQSSGRVAGLADQMPMAVGANPFANLNTQDITRFWSETDRSESMDLWPDTLATVPPVARWGDLSSHLGRVARVGVGEDEVEFFRLADIRMLVCSYLSKEPKSGSAMTKIDEISDEWLTTQTLGPGVKEMAQRLPDWTLWRTQAETSRVWLFPVSNPPEPGTDPRLLPRPPPARRKMVDRATMIHDVDDQIEWLRISGNAKSSGVLVLSDLEYPGWSARLTQNGETVDAKIERAFGRWRAVAIPDAGEFQVELRYEPGSFATGVWISIGAIVFCCLCFCGTAVSAVFVSVETNELQQ